MRSAVIAVGLAASLCARALAAPTAEALKDASGVPFSEALAPKAAPAEAIRASAAAASPRAFFFSKRQERPGIAAPPSPAPPGGRLPVDGYGSPRMVGLIAVGFVAGMAGMIALSATAPILLAAFIPVGAAFAAQRAARSGARGPRLLLSALKGAILGGLMGPPLAGAWLGAQASELIDRLQNRSNKP